MGEVFLNKCARFISIAAVVGALFAQQCWCAADESEAVTRRNAHDIFKQLIEINTTDSIGSTTVAAEAMAKRLLDAGFPKADVVVLGPNDRKATWSRVTAARAGSKLKPILIIGHLMWSKRSAATGPPILSSLSKKTVISTAAARRT